MKRETQLDKLNALLGLSSKAEEVKTQSSGNVVGITEDQIQTWREVQGIIYFLQAPHLFQPKICKNCGTKFIVSRLFVAYCSYDCITESLRNQGINWNRSNDLEKLALDPQVYNGNEPLWVREPALSKLRGILDELSKMEPTPSPVTKSPSDTIGRASDTNSLTKPSLLSDRPPTMPHPEPTTNSSKKKETKPSRISFG